MLLLRAITGPQDEPDVWTARAHMRADAEEVLDALTDPAMIAMWAPVSFEVAGHAGGRLQAGSHERVTGSVAGMRTAFDVEVRSADTDRLELVAHGPVSLDVAYSFSEQAGGVSVEAAVGVRRGGGLTGQVLRGAVGALLSAGALNAALRRLDASLSRAAEPQLAAA
jgi:hypothetical protein